MTILPITSKIINVDTITFVENATWKPARDPEAQPIDGIIIHFVGGSQLRLTGAEADKARPYLGLAQ